MIMKADDKKLIYNLLKTADAYECGYTREKFAGEVEFKDDTETSMSFPGSTRESAQDSDVQIVDRVCFANVAGSSPTMTTSESPNMTQPSNPSMTETSGITLNELNAKILRCTRCGLARTRNNVVPGMGVEHPDVLVVGEGPGHDEDMQGLPFVGKAGVLLDRMLGAIGLDRKTNCYIANIVKCRPPENRNPLPDEQTACFSFLEAQIHILKPKMILCMGKIAIEKITGQNISINAQHGEFFDYNGIPVMPTYHPSALLRNEELKRPAWEDLKLFKKRLDEIKTN